MSYRLHDRVSLEDVLSWKATNGRVDFQLNRDFDFSLLAEGLALEKLHEFSKLGVNIHVKHTISGSPEKDPLNFQQPAGLGSIFGVALLKQSKTFVNAHGIDERAAFLRDAWTRIIAQRGEVGSGRKRCLISRDPDYVVPEVLRGSQNGFPHLQQFRITIQSIAHRLGTNSEKQYSSREDDALTFIHECAHNSYEHARVDLNGAAIEGLRGVIIEKIILEKDSDIERRQGLPDPVRAYMRRVLQQTTLSRRFFTAYTVVDLGPGIHNTLPRTDDAETSWQRLNRALFTHATRKRGSDLQMGRGLPKVVGSAARLKAFLFVRSSDQLGYLDFMESTEDEVQTLSLREWPNSGDFGEVGTSLTMMWPELPLRGEREHPTLDFGDAN